MSSHDSPRVSAGYSLIEIIVVIAIGGALALVAWPRVSRIAPRYRLDGAARTVAAELQRARGRAIAEGKCSTVSFASGPPSYQVGVATSASPCPTGSGSFTLETSKIVEDTGTIAVEDATSPGSNPPNPIFNPRGGTEVVSSIRLSNVLGDARLVVVNAAGRVLIQ